jgi:RNA 2',3'-cyclic 3'-phosphodiesterase
VRLFIAINLPDDVRERIHAAAEPLRRAAPDIAWTPAERLHLTLKFLGERPESELASLAAMLADVGGRHAPLALTIEGGGAFPSLARPRVIWAGVAADPRLELLHHDVEAACAALGHEPEGRAFRPHLTLGRARGGIDSAAGRVAISRAAREIALHEDVDVDAVDLMRSDAGPGGPRYTRLAAGALRRT